MTVSLNVVVVCTAVLIVLILFVGVLPLFLSRRRKSTCLLSRPTCAAQINAAPNKLIITCTTWFDAPVGGKWESFQFGMRSLMEHHPGIEHTIDSWLVINEPTTKASPDWKNLMTVQFPWIQFTQKTEKNRGQAKSLNLILDKIKPYRHWLQWEEAWFCTRPFLQDALTILESNPSINQLQLTRTPPSQMPDWFQQRKQGQDTLGWALVPSQPEVFKALQIKDIDMTANRIWPVYSLRPSLNTVSFYEALPGFSTRSDMWPLRFEWDFGRNWVLAGGVKAILLDAPVTRSDTHKSTYSSA